VRRPPIPIIDPLRSSRSARVQYLPEHLCGIILIVCSLNVDEGVE
jgi:hypothetical protein